MKKDIKKGFTLVELLVVIAILAILATVSIVGYTSFIKKAELANDETLITQWNKLLNGLDVLKDRPINVIKVKEIFEENNYTKDYLPQTENNYFYWNENDNRVYLISKDNTVIYPEDDYVQNQFNNHEDYFYRLDKEYVSVTYLLTNCTLDTMPSCLEKGREVTFTVTANDGFDLPSSIDVTGATYTWDKENGELEIKDITNDIIITIEATATTCCFAKGTKITMTDGSLKNIEDVVKGDVILSYNHEAGKYEAQKVSLVYKGEVMAKPFTLYFEDGTKVSLTNSHCLFEEESLKYVLISKNNVESLIGNHYFSANANDYIELIAVTFSEEPVEYYTLYTGYNFNYFAEGMLNISDDIAAYLNFYTIREDLSVDLDVLNDDIARYGLLEYSPDLGIGSEGDFEIWQAKYGYIILGKGLMTWDDVDALARQYETLNK